MQRPTKIQQILNKNNNWRQIEIEQQQYHVSLERHYI